MHAASGGMLFVSMQMRWVEGQQLDTHATSHKGQSICDIAMTLADARKSWSTPHFSE